HANLAGDRIGGRQPTSPQREPAVPSTPPRVLPVAQQIRVLLRAVRRRPDKQPTPGQRRKLAQLSRRLYLSSRRANLKVTELVRLAKIVYGRAWRTPPLPEEPIPRGTPPEERVYIYRERVRQGYARAHPHDAPCQGGP